MLRTATKIDHAPHAAFHPGRSAQIVALAVPTIELAGGSVRCMLAGVHLARR
jgi:hypothetical protein